MLTRIMQTNEESLELARDIIQAGGLVAFPTETVYGLGANALDEQACRKIFEVKGRPSDNPLIVHVHRDYDISSLVTDIPEYAVRLREAYLPGPLTMVFRSLGTVCPAVSCGLDTVAIRVPSHPKAQEFLKYVKLPIAAPSANISKHVSPTSAEHVLADFNGLIPLILDGGECTGGIESTVLDCTGEIPVVLRSGLVTREMIAEIAGDCKTHTPVAGEKVRSPGMKYSHYSPRCRTALYAEKDLDAAVSRYDAEEAKGAAVSFICLDSEARKVGQRKCLNIGMTAEEGARNLYRMLREGERELDMIIGIAPAGRDGVMAGLMNRFEKACGGVYEEKD
ncbi:MAG: threonylcarbamoyl-AMP synthase [Clostridia bacterium]|nr:threonylcarbamoyl-AMP synthase [Clostridia bacterium]